jgi:act minimal PKS chain-length factor (CLF/KS beta)
MTTPVIITGMGVVAPNGVGSDAYWEALLAGKSAIGQINAFDASGYPVRLAGEARDFDGADHLPARMLKQTDRATQMSLVAADWALADAGVCLEDLDDFDMGVITASSSGGFEFGQNELRALWSKGSQYVSAYQSFAWFYAVNTGQISIRHGMRGPSGVLVSEQAGGLDAIGHSRRLIRKGTGLVVSGGIDGALCPWGWVAQVARGECSTAEDPDRAYRPFTDDAEGYVPGEGGAILVVEDSDAAAARGGGPGYAEVAGYAATFDPRPGTGTEPGLRRAIQAALDDGRVPAEDVDVVFADAAGLPEADRVEAEAINAVFAGRETPVPVTAPKTMTGRLSAGAGPVDLVAACLAIRDEVIPPTINVERPSARYRLDLVRQTRPTRVRAAVVVARGNCGFNSAVVLRAPGSPSPN